MEHGFFIVYLPTKNDEFSKAMLVYQRVTLERICARVPLDITLIWLTETTTQEQ